MKKKTTVGEIDKEVLAFTAGQDVCLDKALIEEDCLGTAAHVIMLSRMPGRKLLISRAECKKVVKELSAIVRNAKKGAFQITLKDQDVHLAVERVLTRKLGALGKKVHTGRSRNDQVAVDLRLYAKNEILGTMEEALLLATGLVAFARKHAGTPIVGRTHMQPAMPGSVGLWASAHAESLLDDVTLLASAYELNNRCPLGSAASYGVPLPIDRKLVSALLGFARPIHNVLYANNARGKLESIILSALGQVMLSLSRLAQDLVLFTMPEFGYFNLPAAFCTGSSIMPQKKNPDVLELIRAKTSKVLSNASAVADMIRAAPSGYNRDLQEAKAPFMEGFKITRTCLRIMIRLVKGLSVNRKALLAAFTPEVFATDHALELVAGGMAFRDAYHYVKQHLDELQPIDPYQAIARKKHWGGPAGLDFPDMQKKIGKELKFVAHEKRAHAGVVRRLMAFS